MNSIEFFELLVSLSLQVTILVLIARTVSRFITDVEQESRLWKMVCVIILTLTIRAAFFPRLRTFQPWKGIDPARALDVAALEQKIGLVLFACWGTGCLISLIQFLLRWTRVHRFLKTCYPWEADDPVLPNLNAKPLPPSRGTSAPLFLISDQLQSPFCWQIHRPLIVFPEFILEFDKEDLRLIVLHEHEHLRTGDPLGLFIQRIVEVIYWFHPFIWSLSQHAAQAREFACDNAAVTSRDEIARYLRCLLKIVERSGVASGKVGLELEFGRGAGLLARRAERLTMHAQNIDHLAPSNGSSLLPLGIPLMAAVMIGFFVWIPVDSLKSPRSAWSPWPSWSAATLHTMGVTVRDYDIYDQQHRLEEIQETIRKAGSDHPAVR